MLILSRKLNQQIVFPNLGVTIEVMRIRGSTVCLGIDAPKKINILRGELESLRDEAEAQNAHSQHLAHELRNRLNAMSLSLQILKEYHEANLAIDPNLLARALHELHTIEEICACNNQPNPFVTHLEQKQSSPFVMVIDDAINEAELLAGYLRHVGIQVAMSCDGRAALSLLECITRKPDVILLDMVMPGLDGQELLEKLRSNPLYDDIKVFAVTGLPPKESSTSHTAMVDRWFQKPIQPPQLVDSIRGELAITA